MKKTFIFLLAIMANACLFAASYTVAGNSSVVFETSWDPSNTNNDMILANGVYTLTKDGVTLPAGDIEFKVCLNHAWTTCWPSDNYKLTIDVSGIYDLTFTFIESSKTVGAIATKKEAIEALPSIAMHGNFYGSWSDTENFIQAEDKLTASLKMTLEKGNYEFGMRIGGGGNWTSNGIAFTRNNTSAKIEAGSGNLTLSADTEGEYIFTWTFASNTLTISFPQENVDPEDPQDPKEPTYSGFCGAEGDGSNLAWALYMEDSLLVITGKGEMKNWGAQTMVPWYGYNYGMKVKSISLPDGLTSIGSYAFGGCNKVTSITIPNSVTSIGICAFEACYALESVHLPDGITEIKTCTFRYSPVKNINIPNSVTSIGEYAFWGTALESIIIPNSVTSIGRYAFGECPFNYITCEAVTPPTLDYAVFYKVNTSIPLYVPAESVRIYKEKSQWREFKPILPIGFTGHIITFVNWDGMALLELLVDEGIIPEYTGATPTRPADKQYTYTFTGWSPNIVAATEDATYTATYSNVLNTYTISSNAVHGRVEGIGEYAYGTEIELKAVPDDGYVFDQWSDGVKDNPRTIIVIGDSEYIASFIQSQGVESINVSAPIQKVIINEDILILRGDKIYTATGAEVK